MKRLLLAATCLSLLAPASLAGGFDRRLISADADWVAHFDIEAFLASSLFRSIADHDLDFDIRNDDDYREFADELGVDPLAVAKSLTLYGTDERPDDPVAILWATAEFDRVIERIRREDEYRSLTEHGLELHGWNDDGDNGAFHVYTTRAGERLVIYADTTRQIADAVQVLRGERPSLSQSTEPRLTAEPAVGAFLFVQAAGGLSSLSGLDPVSTVAEMANGLILEVGESRSRINLRLAIDTESGEDAMGISQIINGARALAALAGGDIPQEVLGLINAVQVQSRGTQVLIEFNYDSTQLLRDLEEISGEGRSHGHRSHEHDDKGDHF